MVITGKAQGAAARKYPDYCYRKPIKNRLDIFSIDPARIDPLREYPRIIEKPAYTAELKTVELADFEAAIGAMNEKGESKVTVTILPNEYTQAKAPRVVYEMVIHGILPNSVFCLEEAMRRCFRGV